MEQMTEAEVLHHSDAYLAELVADKRLGSLAPRICHHIFPRDGAKADCYIPELPRKLRAIVPEARIDVLGDPVGIEVWQETEPERTWLSPLISALHRAADECSAVYAGWSYEPRRVD
jgi:hypothetical protein